MATVDYTGAAPRSQKEKNGEIPSILDWNAVTGKGTNDDTTELNALIAQAPRGGMAHLPKGVYVHTGNLALPNKPLVLFGDGSMKPENWWQRVGPITPDPASLANLGSVLWNSAATQHFDPSTLIDTQLSFKDVGFYGGTGVIKVPNLSTSVNLHIENIFAMFCSGVAFEIGEDDTTGDAYFTSFERSWFYNCGTFILNHFNCDLLANNCVFQDPTARALDIRGSNTRIQNSSFWGNNGATEDILLTPTGNTLAHVLYMVKLFHNKFGNENSVLGESRVKIRVGNPTIKAANPDYFVADLQSRGNTFVGTAPTVGNPTACIALHSPLLNSSFDDHFLNATYAIDDSDATQVSPLGASNRLKGKLTNGVIPFTSGGVSFSEISSDYGVKADPQPSAKDHLRIQNLISLSEDISGWSLFALTVTTGQGDPFGGTGACRLNKTGAFGSAGIGVTTTATGTQVLSGWLKSDSVAQCVLEIQDGSSNVLARLFIGLDGTWRRYSVRLAGISSGATLVALIYPDLPPTATAETIFAFGFQINSGDEASGYQKTTGPAISGTYGLRVPHDLSVGRDALVDRDVVCTRDVKATRNMAAVIQRLTEGLLIEFPFSYVGLSESSSGLSYRWTLNNDGTLRLQRFSGGYTTIIDTPFRVHASDGEIELQVPFRLAAVAFSKVLHSDGGGLVYGDDVDLASEVTGDLSTSHLDGGSGASASTFWRGDGSWATVATVGISTSGNLVTSVSFSTDVIDIDFVDSVDFVTPDYTTANLFITVVTGVTVTDVAVVFSNGLWVS